MQPRPPTWHGALRHPRIRKLVGLWGIVPALRRDTAKSPFAYNDFLALWKGLDVPILKEANAESAKLHETTVAREGCSHV